MENYKLTVGLEIHLELKTKTKMFCVCKNDPDEERPNVNICPVCLGHPGTLPVINKEAVKHIRKVGLALGGKLAQQSVFDRKNYFYPDIPKGYQISQYKHPLVSGGNLSGAVITRVHLEEDTAKSSHSKDASLVDFNRSGVPLMELVTEPCIKSASEAAKFAKELQLLVQYLEISEANMEKGEMRIEANISVSKNASLGTKVEVKNLNSFKVVEKAIDYEYKRQSALLEGGEKVVQETRGWDEASQSTFSQRSKEDSHDYRYFNDPDLPSLDL
ncbi:MAG: Asp-tRNA(Asn)/Glu-tRNA(Gln) amidotransferase subunit GatB, partial [Patescibacteria group bacterium]